MPTHDIKTMMWVAKNRGKMTEIAKQARPPVSPQFVHQVLNGVRKSKNGSIEKALRSAGAPI